MVDGVESGRKIKEAKTRQLLWSNVKLSIVSYCINLLLRTSVWQWGGGHFVHSGVWDQVQS